MAKQRKSNCNSMKNKRNQKQGGCGCGCGCGISGGKTRSKKQMKGGSINLESLPIRYYHQLNTEENNPQDPSLIGNSTKQFLGGKSKKNLKNKKSKKNLKNKKNKTFSRCRIMSKILTGTMGGSNILYNLQQGQNNVTVQPVGSLNNEHSHPYA